MIDALLGFGAPKAIPSEPVSGDAVEKEFDLLYLRLAEGDPCFRSTTAARNAIGTLDSDSESLQEATSKKDSTNATCDLDTIAMDVTIQYH